MTHMICILIGESCNSFLVFLALCPTLCVMRSKITGLLRHKIKRVMTGLMCCIHRLDSNRGSDYSAIFFLLHRLRHALRTAFVIFTSKYQSTLKHIFVSLQVSFAREYPSWTSKVIVATAGGILVFPCMNNTL